MKKLVTLYDKTAERYGNPTVATNLAVAERDFATGCKEPKSPMMQYPADISLVYLGDYDENTGKIIPQKQPITIAKAKDYVKIEGPLKEATIVKNPEIQEIKQKFENGQINKDLDNYAKNLKIRR